MRALTICQPYPTLICLPESDPRHKRVENRRWFTSYRGPLLIHAGKSRGWLGEGSIPDPSCESCKGAGFVDCDTGHPVDVRRAYEAGAYVHAEECGCGVPADEQYGVPLADMAFGAVVAVANLLDCFTATPLADGRNVVEIHARKRYPWLMDHRHLEGPYAWVLGDVRPLAEPVPCRGAQGLWVPPRDVLAAVLNGIGQPVAC